MNEAVQSPPEAGQPLLGRGGRKIGTIDAVFADYLLVRTSGLLPVDLYVPRVELAADGRPVARRGVRRLAPAAEAGSA